MFQDLKEYIENNNEYNSLNNVINEFLQEENKNWGKYPLCILSHMYDKRRSKLINQLVSELDSGLSLNRKVYIFVYEDQKERYKFLEKYSDNINMVYIKPTEENSTLTGKRNYIINYSIDNDFSNIFKFEDDTFNLCLPLMSKTIKSGLQKNKKFNLTCNSAFSLWEFIIDKFDLKYSAPLIENSFIWAVKPYLDGKITQAGYSCIQGIHLNVEFMKNNSLKYDEKSGWDDFDMNLQFCVAGQLPTLIPMGYHTISLKSGLSTIENSNLEKRCERNSNLFVNKWGEPLTKLVTKRELTNARIQWRALKKILNEGKNLKDFINGTSSI